MLLTYIFLLLALIIISLTIYIIAKYYLKTREKIQNNKHYPITLALILISIPIISIFSSLDILLIQLINTQTSFNIAEPKDTFRLIFYVIYIMAISIVIYFQYKITESMQDNVREKSIHYKLDYPELTVESSPHLHERIKELFELKHEKQNLKLSYDEKEQVLVGYYSDSIHSYQYIMYVDMESNSVSKAFL